MNEDNRKIFFIDGMYVTSTPSKEEKVKQLNELERLGKNARLRLMLAEIENNEYQRSYYAEYINNVYAAMETILEEEEQCIR